MSNVFSKRLHEGFVQLYQECTWSHCEEKGVMAAPAGRVCGMSGTTGDLPWPLSFKLVPNAEEIEREKRTSYRLSSSDNLSLNESRV